MYIARDKCGKLKLFVVKPFRHGERWFSIGPIYSIDPGLFPEVKWKDEEPRELVLKPIKKD